MSFTNNIGDLKQVLTQVAPANETRQPRTRGAESPALAPAPVIQGDATSLSQTGGLMAQALGSSDVRTAKVEDLRNAIANGSYNVPSSEVADKIIHSMTD